MVIHVILDTEYSINRITYTITCAAGWVPEKQEERLQDSSV